MALRLNRYQRDSVKAYSLAKGGINLAIVVLQEDAKKDAQSPPAYDAPDELWANNEEEFKNISFGNDKDEFAVVYYIEKIGDSEEIKYGVTDEERKININKADKSLLASLPGISEDLANNILAWRGDKDPDIPESAKDYEALGYTYKNETFVNIEELLVVKGLTEETYNQIKDLITVWGEKDGKININTASPEILIILANSVAKDNERGCVDVVVNEILRQRAEKKYFTTLSEIVISDDLVGGTSSDVDLFNISLKPNLIVTSNYFRIISEGNVDGLKREISCVYDRDERKIVFWHEN
ncbi:MAG: helix-hairpin-helix domain-containing protein [Candidatus Omnitrophota bacterium]